MTWSSGFMRRTAGAVVIAGAAALMAPMATAQQNMPPQQAPGAWNQAPPMYGMPGMQGWGQRPQQGAWQQPPAAGMQGWGQPPNPGMWGQPPAAAMQGWAQPPRQGMWGMPGMYGMPTVPGAWQQPPAHGMWGMRGMYGMPGMAGMAAFEPGVSGTYLVTAEGVIILTPNPDQAGMAGMEGMPGMGGMQGMPGMDGMSGMDGMQGMPGMTGEETEEGEDKG